MASARQEFGRARELKPHGDESYLRFANLFLWWRQYIVQRFLYMKIVPLKRFEELHFLVDLVFMLSLHSTSLTMG